MSSKKPQRRHTVALSQQQELASRPRHIRKQKTKQKLHTQGIRKSFQLPFIPEFLKKVSNQQRNDYSHI